MNHCTYRLLSATFAVLCTMISPALSQNHSHQHSTEKVDPVRVILGALDIRLTPELMDTHGITFAQAAEVALDQGAGLYLRVRALAGAAMVGEEAAHVLLKDIVEGDEHIEIRRQAIISLSRIFGRQTPRVVALELRALMPACPDSLQARIEHETAWLDTLPSAPKQGAEVGEVQTGQSLRHP